MNSDEENERAKREISRLGLWDFELGNIVNLGGVTGKYQTGTLGCLVLTYKL